MTDIAQCDKYLNDDGPAALVLREWLMPVEGPDGVLFPATFASGDGFPGGYNIDVFPDDRNIGEARLRSKDGSTLKPTIDLFPGSPNMCLIDSVGSQANRIEPLFMKEPHSKLVPQIVIQARERKINILEAGHRAADAIVRCSELDQVLHAAFLDVRKGNASALAKIAPTSLVFGVWDSRGTQEKLPRLVSSTIRAFNVRRLTRGAVYLPPIPYVDEGLVDESLDTGKGKDNPLSQKGYKHNPASGTHGGVIADGGIRRDATLGLAALRLLRAGNDEEATRKLQRYILGLALVAFTAHTSNYLRQGCMLVHDPEKAKENEHVEVYPDGKRKPLNLTDKEALDFAEAAAKDFGVGKSKSVHFDKERAVKDIKGEGEGKGKKKAAKKKAKTAGGE